jgi:hypothetical protein
LLSSGRSQTLEDHGEFHNPSTTKLVQLVKYPWLEALQDHVVGALDLPVRPGVRHGRPIHTDMVIIAKIKELLLVNCMPLLVMMEFGTPKR